MPPSGRSSSSHSSGSSSSSRSSSRSSSSHSSGSSRSYSGSSSSHSSGSSRSYSGSSSGSRGPSRSSSSHSSGSLFGSHRPSSRSTSSHKQIPTGGVPIRGHKNQPRGYNRKTPGYQPPTTYHCRNHDYVYYAFGWKDADTGTDYKPGYYDENGKYYDDVAFKDKSSGILTMKCEYCGTEIKTKWTEGAQPNCPNCNAVLKINRADELLSSYNESTDIPEKKEKRKWHPVLMVFMLLLLYGAILNKEPSMIFLAVAILGVTSPYVSQYLSKGALVGACAGIILLSSVFLSLTSEDEITVNTTTNDSSYYVEALGRSCKWYDEYDSYYDKETDCYFVYNDAFDTWQYWYEGISSDFGDYGWMEYDEKEAQWYIEASAENWIVLPKGYDTDMLWHMEE